MNKNQFIVALSMTVMVSCTQAQDIQTLPTPDKSVAVTLMQALDQRHSVRQFSDKELTEMQLSQLLWAACGINRKEEGKITAPSAMNMQDIKVYVCRSNGSWLYNPTDNTLTKVCADDLRASIAGRQESVKAAPIHLLLVSDQRSSKFKSPEMGYLDGGYVSQNICLACTALGLATVPRGSMDKEALTKALGLEEGQMLVANHPVGYELTTTAK